MRQFLRYVVLCYSAYSGSMTTCSTAIPVIHMHAIAILLRVLPLCWSWPIVAAHYQSWNAHTPFKQVTYTLSNRSEFKYSFFLHQPCCYQSRYTGWEQMVAALHSNRGTQCKHVSDLSEVYPKHNILRADANNSHVHTQYCFHYILSSYVIQLILTALILIVRDNGIPLSMYSPSY